MIWTRQSRSLCLCYDKGNGTILDTYLNRKQNLSAPTNGKRYFENPKSIGSKIVEGVSLCDQKLPTCLTTKFWATGFRFFLMQRKCTCPNRTQTCFPDGWRPCLIGGSFVHLAETRWRRGPSCGVWAAPMQIFCLRMHGPGPYSCRRPQASPLCSQL